MIVTPKHPFVPGAPNNHDPDGITLIPGPDGEGMMIECEIVTPPSRIGGTVYVYVKPSQVIATMKAARRAAERARMEPLEPTEAHA
jgi:hypothetical protein